MTQEIPTITTTERKRDHFPTVDEAYFCVHNKSRYKSDLLVAVALHLGEGASILQALTSEPPDLCQITSCWSKGGGDGCW